MLFTAFESISVTVKQRKSLGMDSRGLGLLRQSSSRLFFGVLSRRGLDPIKLA